MVQVTGELLDASIMEYLPDYSMEFQSMEPEGLRWVIRGQFQDLGGPASCSAFPVTAWSVAFRLEGISSVGRARGNRQL